MAPDRLRGPRRPIMVAMMTGMAALGFASCDGPPTPHPISVTTDRDERLSCDDLHGARAVSGARLADLNSRHSRESADKDTGNKDGAGKDSGEKAAPSVAKPATPDKPPRGADEADIAALKARIQVLDGIITRKCPQGDR